jgi:hypothetical protein
MFIFRETRERFYLFNVKQKDSRFFIRENIVKLSGKLGKDKDHHSRFEELNALSFRESFPSFPEYLNDSGNTKAAPRLALMPSFPSFPN